MKALRQLGFLKLNFGQEAPSEEEGRVLALFRNRAVGGPVIALATFGAIGIAQWPLPIVLVVVLPISLALAWVRR